MNDTARVRRVAILMVVALGAPGLFALMEAGSAPSREPVVAPRNWMSHLEEVDEALAAGGLDRAVRAWQEAYGTALASRSWEAMLAVGDAALRIGDPGRSRDAVATARQAYLTAFFRARAQRSVGGLLQTAEAFATLGDSEVASQALGLADRVTIEEKRGIEETRVRDAATLPRARVQSAGLP